MQIVPPVCMIYQNLFSWTNKENISNLSSAELALRVVKVNLFVYFCKLFL